MKRFLFGIVIFLVAIAIFCFSIKSSISNKIEAKIEELNQNGFAVSYKQNSKIGKTLGKGEVEIVYPNKVFSYLLSKIKDEDMKKSLEDVINLLDDYTKEELLEGVTFEYDFIMSNFSSSLDLNIYLTRLSQRTMYAFEQDNAYQPKNRWLQDLLQNRKVHLYIDENRNFKLDDIRLTIPNSSFMSLRGINGSPNSLNVLLLKVSDIYDNSNKFIVDDLTLHFNSQKNHKTSKMTIGSVEYEDYQGLFDMKNLIVDSKTTKEKDTLSGSNAISFDELNVKIDKKVNPKNIELKKTTLNIGIDNLPLQKYEEAIEALTNKDTVDAQEEVRNFLKEALKNDVILNVNGESSNLKVDDKNYFNSLKFNSDFKLDKNLSSSIESPKGIADIFDTMKATIDIDDKSEAIFLESLSTLAKDKKIEAVNIENNQKRFEIELKDDGLYLNNEKLLENKDLEFSSLDEIKSEAIGKVQSSYKLIDKDTLRVTFKYNTKLKSLKGGGIAVSFPQFKDASKIKAHNTSSFSKIDYYAAGQDIYSGYLGKNVKSQYLMVEGWDWNWNDPSQEKEFSLDIDISELSKDKTYGYLEINLRGGAIDANDNSELVPSKNSGAMTDQQSYPVKIADIYLLDLKIDDLAPMEPLVTPPSGKK